MAEQEDDKTEEPTAKRLSDARKEGQIPRSQEINNALVFVGMAITFGVFGAWICKSMFPFLRDPMENFHQISMDGPGLRNYLANLLIEVAKIAMVPFLLLLGFGITASLWQTGFLITGKPITPNFEKISPLAGLKRLFSVRHLVEFIKGLAKIAVVVAIGYVVLLPELSRVEIIVSMPLDQVFSEIEDLIIKFLIAIVVFMTVVAIADYTYQVYQHHKNLRMTLKEIKEEYKNTEGDPLIKAKLRRIRLERHRNNLRQAMKRATVVVTNPTHFAVALEYDYAVHEVPIVIAKGQDHLALVMRNLAREYGITIVENPLLARTLFQTVKVNQPIPEELFTAVSNIIRYVYAKTGRKINDENVEAPDDFG